MNFIKEFKNLPNQITLIRLILIPFLLYFSYTKNVSVFMFLYLIAGLSDFFDGIIARKYNLCTNFGAKLDSIADEIISSLTIVFVYFLLPEVILKYIYYVILVAVLLFVRFLIYLIKFKNKTRLHLLSSKFVMFFLYFCISIVLIFNYEPIIPICIIVCSIALTEELLVLLTRKKIHPDMKSLFQIKK